MNCVEHQEDINFIENLPSEIIFHISIFLNNNKDIISLLLLLKDIQFEAKKWLIEIKMKHVKNLNPSLTLKRLLNNKNFINVKDSFVDLVYNNYIVAHTKILDQAKKLYFDYFDDCRESDMYLRRLVKKNKVVVPQHLTIEFYQSDRFALDMESEISLKLQKEYLKIVFAYVKLFGTIYNNLFHLKLLIFDDGDENYQFKIRYKIIKKMFLIVKNELIDSMKFIVYDFFGEDCRRREIIGELISIFKNKLIITNDKSNSTILLNELKLVLVLKKLLQVLYFKDEELIFKERHVKYDQIADDCLNKCIDFINTLNRYESVEQLLNSIFNSIHIELEIYKNIMSFFISYSKLWKDQEDIELIKKNTELDLHQKGKVDIFPIINNILKIKNRHENLNKYKSFFLKNLRDDQKYSNLKIYSNVKNIEKNCVIYSCSKIKNIIHCFIHKNKCDDINETYKNNNKIELDNNNDVKNIMINLKSQTFNILKKSIESKNVESSILNIYTNTYTWYINHISFKILYKSLNINIYQPSIEDEKKKNNNQHQYHNRLTKHTKNNCNAKSRYQEFIEKILINHLKIINLIKKCECKKQTIQDFIFNETENYFENNKLIKDQLKTKIIWNILNDSYFFPFKNKRITCNLKENVIDEISNNNDEKNGNKNNGHVLIFKDFYIIFRFYCSCFCRDPQNLKNINFKHLPILEQSEKQMFNFIKLILKYHNGTSLGFNVTSVNNHLILLLLIKPEVIIKKIFNVLFEFLENSYDRHSTNDKKKYNKIEVGERISSKVLQNFEVFIYLLHNQIKHIFNEKNMTFLTKDEYFTYFIKDMIPIFKNTLFQIKNYIEMESIQSYTKNYIDKWIYDLMNSLNFK
jgi:hypothetical protein